LHILPTTKDTEQGFSAPDITAFRQPALDNILKPQPDDLLEDMRNTSLIGIFRRAK